MIRSDTFQGISGRFAENREGITYLVLHLYDKDILFFNKGMVWGVNDATEGSICINDPVALGYVTCGVWKVVEDYLELTIHGKGVFHLTVKNLNQFFLYELLGSTSLERLAIDAVKNSKFACL